MGLAFINELVERAAVALAVPRDLIRVAICLLLSFGFGATFFQIGRGHDRFKETLCIAGSAFYLLGVFDMPLGFLSLIASSCLTYLLATTWPKSPLMPWLNFLVSMLWLFAINCADQFGGHDYVNELGISGSQMLLVIKLTSFAWDVYDGTRPAEQLSPHQQSACLRTHPPFLRFLAWTLFPPTILTGPVCGYHEFSDCLDMSAFVVDDETKKLHVPSPLLPALIKTLEGIFWTALFIFVGGRIPTEFYQDRRYIRLNFALRTGVLWLLSFFYRLKYYAAWCLAEATCMVAGLAFNGYDANGHARWDRVRNVNPLRLELSQNIFTVLSNWNINTAKWLRHYVYLRVTPRGKKPGARSTAFTFFISAFWHGIRPGYYLTLVSAALLQVTTRYFRRTVRPIFVDTCMKPAYDVASWVGTQAMLGYFTQPFVMLNLGPSLTTWSGVYFWPHVALALSWIALAGPLAPRVVPVLRTLQRASHKLAAHPELVQSK